jgi:ribosomal-protein-alanine acetyltransferase
MRLEDVARAIEIATSGDEAPRWAPDVYERALDPEAAPVRISLVAEDPEAGILGFLVTVLIPPQAELEMIAVSRAARRQGIARGLMAAMMAELKERHITEVMLEVRESNHPARLLYVSVGFAETGRRPAYYSDPQEDAILLQRSVGGQHPELMRP